MTLIKLSQRADVRRGAFQQLTSTFDFALALSNGCVAGRANSETQYDLKRLGYSAIMCYQQGRK